MQHAASVSTAVSDCSSWITGNPEIIGHASTFAAPVVGSSVSEWPVVQNRRIHNVTPELSVGEFNYYSSHAGMVLYDIAA